MICNNSHSEFLNCNISEPVGLALQASFYSIVVPPAVAASVWEVSIEMDLEEFSTSALLAVALLLCLKNE